MNENLTRIVDKLYLPVDPDDIYPNVETQEKDSGSLLNSIKKLISVRNNNREFSPDKDFTLLKVDNPGDLVAFFRGGNVICLFNLGSTEVECNVVCKFGESYNVLASTEGCRVEITEKKLHSIMKPRSYIILKFNK